MLKPPAANMPGMTDTLDFVKNLWGSMNLPGASLSGMSTPPMSADDLDKRIADLKAVESWLNMNLTMLRGTIQAMEVQRATLSTLKSMGASMAEAMRQSGVSAEKMAGMPFASFFGQTETKANAKPDAKAAPQANAPAGGQPSTGGPSAGTASAGGASAQPGTAAPAGPDAAAAAMGMPAALAWWNMLQDQFQQAVTSAMTPPPESAPKPEAKAKDTPAATPPQPTAEAPAGANGRSRAAKPKPDKS